MKKHPLPAIVSPISPDLRRYLDRVRDFLDDPDGFVTKKELVSTGIFTKTGSGVIGYIDPSDTTTCVSPPAPLSLAASGAMTSVVLSWKGVNYSSCYSHTEIYRAATDDLGVATLIGTTTSGIFTDAVGSDSVKYYWVRFVNIKSDSGPYNATAGVKGETSPDLEYVLDQLSEAYGDGTAAPFFEVPGPPAAATVINGATIAPGLYMYSAFIHDAAITNAKIKNLAVDHAKIALLAVEQANIADLAVTNAKINDLDAGKITAGYISADVIDANTITGDHIDSNTITASNLVISSVSAAIGESDNLLHTGRFVNSSIGEWEAPTGLTAPVFYDASNDGQTFTGAIRSSTRDVFDGDAYFSVSSNETLFVSGWIRTEFSDHDCRIGLNFKDDNNAANETWTGVLHKLALPFGERMVLNDISIALNSLIDGSSNPGELVITSTHLITPNGENVVTTSPVQINSPYGEGEAGTYYIMYTVESRATRFSGLSNPGTSTQFVNVRYDATAATWQAFGNIVSAGTVIDFIPLFDDFIVASVYAETTTGGLSDAMVTSHSHDSHHHHQDWQYITGTITAPDNVTKARGWIQQDGTSGFGTVEVANFIITREPSGAQILDEILIAANITTAVNNGTTTIDGSNITTGSIYADKLNVNALAAITIKADQIISHSVGGEAFDISSFGDAGPNSTANIYGGVIEGAVIEGGFLVAMGEYEYTNSFYNTQPSCSFAEEVAGKWRYPKQFGYTLSNAGHASIVSAGTYEYDFYAWNYCANTLRRLTSPTGTLTISAQTGMLTASGTQSCSCSRSSDKTWTISANIHGVTATLTIRVHVGFNSSDGYGTIYIDGTSVNHDSDWNGASGSHTGSKIINNVPLNYSISWSADDYQGGFWSINGYYSYNVRVDVDESVRDITLDGDDTISFTTTGGSMKIPPATMALT